MTAAIFGLVGVIVGGILNGVVTYVLEGRRDARAVMAGARLLLEEISGIKSSCETVLMTQTWSTLPQYPMEITQWEQYRTVMAARVRQSSDWRKLSAPFSDARLINHLAARKQMHQALGNVVPSMFERAIVRADEAITVLAPFVRGEHLAWPRFKRHLGIGSGAQRAT